MVRYTNNRSIWLIFCGNFFILIFSLLIAVCIGVISDIWFYGEWVFTPWNYLYFNLVLGKASEFGTNPWWYYFYLFFIKVIPPISILLLLFFIMGAIRNKYSVLLWIIVPFFVIHMLIGHKEMRFLFPVFPLFVVLVSLGFDYLISGMKRKGLLLVVYCTFGINICLFLFRTFIPAQILFSYHRYLYQIAEDQNYLLISINQAPYDYVGLPVSFYRSPNIETKHFETYDQVESYIENHQDKPILFLHTTQVLDYEFSGFKSKRIYTILPEWISKFNINNWQSRSRIYSIYSLDKVKTL